MTARKDKIQLACPICKTLFEVHPCKVNKRVCCSVECTTVNKRRARQTEIETQFGKPIADLLREMYCDQQMGIKAIAKAIGVSDRNLWSWLDELGIERRDRSTAVALQWVDNDARREISADIIRAVGADYRRKHGAISKRPDVRQKISESKRGEKNAMYGKFGALNPTWTGGKVTYRGRGWRGIRLQIIRRDGGKCRRCGSTERLEVHHIVPYRETQDNSFENLVTLCNPCHTLVEDHGATWSDHPHP